MIAVRLPEYESRLQKLAEETGRSKSFYVKQLFDRHFSEIESRFEVDSIGQIKNKATLKAIADAKQGKNVKRHKTSKELFKSWEHL